MEGKYPIINDGALIGELCISKNGGFTVFEAACRALPGVTRLSVYGGGREGKLGVMLPGEDGKMYLRKSLSRAAMAEFPGEIDHVGFAGEKISSLSEALSLMELDEEIKEEQSPKQDLPEPQHEPLPDPAPPARDEDELYWYSSPDGALVCFDGERSLIALPIGDERIPTEVPGSRKLIEGGEYMVYITKNGRIVG